MTRTFRLTRLIKREIARVGNPNRLARKINEANAQAKTGIELTHRTLRKIANKPETVNLTLRLLTALDVYFGPRGESLQDKPIFEKRGILECLVDTRKVTFLLGSRPHRQARRNDLSRWDTRSLAELLSQACKFNVHMEYEIEDVLLNLPMDAKKVAAEKWHARLEDETRALVAIGSPLACLASETMLAKMWGIDPFEFPVPGFGAVDRLPFYYVYPPKMGRQFRSAFGLRWRDLPSTKRDVSRAVQQNKAVAFMLGSELFPVPLKGDRWEMYGTVVAQRRSGGNVWLVVSGLSGPATYAAATLVKKIDAELPTAKGKDSPVLWQPIKAVITASKSAKDMGDNRELESVEPLGAPQIWPSK